MSTTKENSDKDERFTKEMNAAGVRELRDSFLWTGDCLDHDLILLAQVIFDAMEKARTTPSARLEKDEFPLLCEVVDGAIQFVIGANVLAHATNICPTLYDAERDHGRYRVTDPTVFAKAVADELNHEDEAGNTPLTRMLDEAIDDAINQGAEGVEENNDPRQRYVVHSS